VRAFIITRDRVSYAQRTAEAFDAAGLDVVIADHGSTYEPMLEWLSTRDNVYRRGSGHHPRGLWEWDTFRELAGTERYVVSDPDTPPSEDCPSDWLPFLNHVLDSTGVCKAGLGLRIDDLPYHYARRDQVIGWESQYWAHKVAPGLFSAPVDTTIALHAPLSQHAQHQLAGVRTDHPYVADHLPWYEDFNNLPEDVEYYYEHSESGISFWATPGKSCHWED
jgi:hypothetical protein